MVQPPGAGQYHLAQLQVPLKVEARYVACGISLQGLDEQYPLNLPPFITPRPTKLTPVLSGTGVDGVELTPSESHPNHAVYPRQGDMARMPWFRTLVSPLRGP